MIDGQPTPRRFTGTRLVLATHNPGTLAEIGALIAGAGVECSSAAEYGLASPEETGTTFRENAALKAAQVARATGLPALGDDSGFCVDALGGLPGIHALDWAGPGGDFGAACARVLALLAEAAAARGTTDRRARYVTALALCWPDGHVEHAEGAAEGTVALAARGRGFGYDGIFVPEGEARTMAEIEENASGTMAARGGAHSHRTRALRTLLSRCFGYRG